MQRLLKVIDIGGALGLTLSTWLPLLLPIMALFRAVAMEVLFCKKRTTNAACIVSTSETRQLTYGGTSYWVKAKTSTCGVQVIGCVFICAFFVDLVLLRKCLGSSWNVQSP